MEEHQYITVGSLIAIRPGRCFEFGEGDEGVVLHVDPRTHVCRVRLVGKSEPVVVALRDLVCVSSPKETSPSKALGTYLESFWSPCPSQASASPSNRSPNHISQQKQELYSDAGISRSRLDMSCSSPSSPSHGHTDNTSFTSQWRDGLLSALVNDHVFKEWLDGLIETKIRYFSSTLQGQLDRCIDQLNLAKDSATKLQEQCDIHQRVPTFGYSAPEPLVVPSSVAEPASPSRLRVARISFGVDEDDLEKASVGGVPKRQSFAEGSTPGSDSEDLPEYKGERLQKQRLGFAEPKGRASYESLRNLGHRQLDLLKDAYKGASYLVSLRESHSITGLGDKFDEGALRVSLYEAAKRPPSNFDFIPEDRSTWSMGNLQKLKLEELIPLQRYAGPDHRSPLQQPVGLVSLKDDAVNMLPFNRYLYATNKLDLVHSSGKILQFTMNAEVFKQGTRANPKRNLEALKLVLFSEKECEDMFVGLSSSPVNAVTLPEAARVRAGIPVEAMFYSFIHPLCDTPQKAQRFQELDINKQDPFVTWLVNGGFVYFDHRYDITAVNALSFEPTDEVTSALFLGENSSVPTMSSSHLTELERWWPTTLPIFVERGFEKFAFVLPSEILGDYIFTKSGGFAFLHKDPAKSQFYPVVPRKLWNDNSDDVLFEEVQAYTASSKIEPRPYDSPLLIEELLQMDKNGSAEECAECDGHKYLSEAPSKALFSSEKQASALGIAEVLGIEYTPRTAEAAIEDMRKELEIAVRHGVQGASDVDKRNLEYVLDEAASSVEVLGNNGVRVLRDVGHAGQRLDDFCDMEEARAANLHKGEVAALRLYTTSTFRLINDPLRLGIKPHPLPVATQLIYMALKKMRAIHMRGTRRWRTIYLWRGLKDLVVDDDFLQMGGTEMACMSTSPNLHVVATYARSRAPLFLRIKVDSPMEMGANIRWLSVFPQEEEVLFPPLTYLKPYCKQSIHGHAQGMVITVKPSFPS